MSEQRLAPKCSAKAGRVNLHHSHPLLTFMMLVGLPFLLLFVWVYVFSPQDRKQKIRLPQKTDVKNRCFLML